MLKERIWAALVLVPIVIIAIFFLPIMWYGLVLVMLIALASWEWSQFVGLTKKSARYSYALVFSLITLIPYYCVIYLGDSLVLLLTLYFSIVRWFIALFLVLTYPKTESLWKNSFWLKSLFGLFTLLPFFSGMLFLRSYLPSYQGGFLVLYVLVLVWATDTGAYFAGRALGKHKLAPNVSPGKTIEGFIGGVGLAIFVSVIVYIVNYFSFSFMVIFISSVIAILISVLGDLTESMFKRQANIKDSSHIIPGHGGILDRIDSLTAAIPLFSLSLIILSSL